MHDIKNIVENTDQVKSNLQKRGFDTVVIDELIAINTARKSYTTNVEGKRAEVNKLSQEVGKLKKSGGDASDIMAQVAAAKNAIIENETKLEEIKEKMNSLLLIIPNLIADDVPYGKSEEENVEIFKSGTPKEFSYTPQDHVDLGEKLGYLDFEAAAQITGARFAVSKGPLAKLERALTNFMIDQHTANGYQEVIPPFIVHERSMYGTGQLPKFKDDAFKIENHDWYLIPTAEVPLTNLKRDQLFDRKELPLKYVANTPCFRSEAGSHGKDTRGLIRVHQFAKVEMVNIVEASASVQAHEDMINRARSILDLLKLPYRGILLCSGDIGFGARKCVDLEVWLPSQNKYREISSVSNCGDFQGRRANIRFRNDAGKAEYAHTLNGSGLAAGRTIVAIMENYQNEDGSITVPDVLIPYMNGVSIIK